MWSPESGKKATCNIALLVLFSFYNHIHSMSWVTHQSISCLTDIIAVWLKLYFLQKMQCCWARLIGRWANSAKHCHPWQQNCSAGLPMAHPYCSSPPTSAQGESPKCQMGAGYEYPSLHLWKVTFHQHDAPILHPYENRALSLTVSHLTTICHILYHGRFKS